MRKITWLLTAVLSVLFLSTSVYGQKVTPEYQKRMLNDGIADLRVGGTMVHDVSNDVVDFSSQDLTKDVLYENGPLVTAAGAGTGGSDYSALQDASLGMNTYGTGCQITAGNSVADDFSVTGGGWNINSFTFYAYQTGSGPPSTLTDVHFQIYDGDPSNGGTVIFGDLSTNVLLSTQWTNIWRVLESSPEENRPIMEVVADASGLFLAPGDYWVEFQVAGSGSSGPWMPPITILGESTTGNAIQHTPSGWDAFVDVGPQGMAFKIEGTPGTQPANDLAVSAITSPVSGVNLGDEAVTITIKNYGTADQSNFDVNYTFDGNTFTETVTDVIASNGTLVYTFGTTVDLSAYGTYSIDACTALVGDENTDNDCKSATVENLEPSLCVDGLYSTGCSWGDGLTTWDLSDVNGLTIECGNGDPYDWYHDWRTTYVHTLTPGTDYTLTAQCGYSNTYVRLWIDFNDNFLLEENEVLVDNFFMESENTDYAIDFTIPADAPQGLHTLRYRTNWNSAMSGDACESLTYGNMADFGAQVEASFNAPTDLMANAIDDDVELLWTNPADIVGIEVYRDGALTATLGVESTYMDIAPGYGTFTYCVKAIYADGISDCSDEASIMLINGDLDPVTNLAASVDGSTVTLTWDAPGGSSAGDSFADSFEDGTFDAWGEVIEGPGTVGSSGNPYWYPSANGANGDAFGAYADWGYTIDSWLITPELTLSASSGLSFDWNSSYYWSVDPNDNSDIFVKVSADGGSTWDILWTYGDIGVWESWVWYNTNLDLSAYAGQTVKIAFNLVGDDNSSNSLDNVVIGDSKGAFGTFAISEPAIAKFDAKSAPEGYVYTSKDLLSYDVYKNGVFLANTAETSFVEENVSPGTYTYAVQAIYDEGPAAMVAVEGVVVEPPSDAIFYDDFEGGTAGDQVYCSGADGWTTWDNSPCGGTDAYYSDAQAHNGSLSMVIEDDNDMVHPIDDYTSGCYEIDFWMYIESGKLGYWNTLQKFAGSQSKWGMQIMYQAGTATLDAAGAAATTFSYPDGAWMHNVLKVDLINDQAELLVDDVSIYTWVWSEGANGGNNLLQLGGSNFYGWTGKGVGKYYIDEYKVKQTCDAISPVEDLVAVSGTPNCDDVSLTWSYPGCTDLEFFNVYRNGDLVGVAPDMTYDDLGLDDGVYSYNVRPVCGGSEGPLGPSVEVEIACDIEVPAPTDLVLEVNGDTQITCTWTAPGNSSVYQIDNNENSSSVGLNSSGEFYCAAQFDGDLDRYGYQLTDISFFWSAADAPDATFTVMAWEGENGALTELVSQEVTAANPDDWTTVDLNDPVMINPFKKLWIGYKVTQPTPATHPAGNDEGPALDGGDMISFDGVSFDVLHELAPSIDANWNIKANVAFGGTYNVYHHIDSDPYELLEGSISGETFVHNFAAGNWGYYYYKVTAVIDGEESVDFAEEFAPVAVSENIASVTSIYPNPATDRIQITSEMNIENVKMFDVAGRMVSDMNVAGNNVTLDVANLNGVYMIQVTTESGVMNAKVVVK